MKIVIPLAEGFEEIEAITNIDVLRRAGIEVQTVSLTEDPAVKGAHGLVVKADSVIDKISANEIEGIVLPGGMPGSRNLRDNDKVIKLIKDIWSENKLVAAICAAPIVLEKAGVLKGKNATSYPGFDKEMPSCNYSEERVVVDENLVTGRGPGVALEFALQLVKMLVNEEKAKELQDGMLACC